jgi:hypothetical protein
MAELHHPLLCGQMGGIFFPSWEVEPVFFVVVERKRGACIFPVIT